MRRILATSSRALAASTGRCVVRLRSLAPPGLARKTGAPVATLGRRLEPLPRAPRTAAMRQRSWSADQDRTLGPLPHGASALAKASVVRRVVDRNAYTTQ